MSTPKGRWQFAMPSKAQSVDLKKLPKRTPRPKKKPRAK